MFKSDSAAVGPMPLFNSQQQTEVDDFLATGKYDNLFELWPGNTFLDRAITGTHVLRHALYSEISRRVGPVPISGHCVAALDIDVRAKFTPMVRGLFSKAEQPIVLDLLEGSVIFLTPKTITRALEKTKWLHTAWELANIYLASLNAIPLADTDHELVGLSEDTNCFVSMKYFSYDNPFDDYVIHEVAHVFHNCKREGVGLTGSRRCEWLLEIDYSKRETFAYACEAYSRILERGGSRLARITLLSELANTAMPPDERVDEVEYMDILQEAVSARNGWKRILKRCSPVKERPRRA